MKLVTFKYQGKQKLGAVKVVGLKEKILDLHQLNPLIPDTMIEFLTQGASALELAKKAVTGSSPESGYDRDSVTLLAPIPNPGKSWELVKIIWSMPSKVELPNHHIRSFLQNSQTLSSVQGHPSSSRPRLKA